MMIGLICQSHDGVFDDDGRVATLDSFSHTTIDPACLNLRMGYLMMMMIGLICQPHDGVFDDDDRSCKMVRK